MLPLWGQPEELKGPLLSKNEVTYRVAHDSGLGYLSVAHIEIFFQDLVNLPALHIHTIVMLKNPSDLICTANMICLLHHLLYHLFDCWTTIAFLYICFSHFFEHMTICLHFPDNLADTSGWNSVLFGNCFLLVTYHYSLVSNLQDFCILKLWPVLDLLSKMGRCLFYPISCIKIVISSLSDRVPALYTFS